MHPILEDTFAFSLEKSLTGIPVLGAKNSGRGAPLLVLPTTPMEGKEQIRPSARLSLEKTKDKHHFCVKSH